MKIRVVFGVVDCGLVVDLVGLAAKILSASEHHLWGVHRGEHDF